MAGKRKKGEGTVRLRKDGRWEGRVVVSYDESGNPKTKNVLAKTKRECVAKLEKLKGECGSVRSTQVRPDMLFRDWLNEWYQNDAKPRLRPTTQLQYEGFLQHHLIPGLGETPLNQLTQGELQQFFRHMKESGRKVQVERYGPGMADRSVRSCHAVCQMALDKAVEEKLIHANPAVGCKLPPLKGKEMKILTLEEIQRFLIQAKAEGMYELFLLELTTGMRRGELLALQWDDLDFHTGKLHIDKQVYPVGGKLVISEPKTKAATRTIILPPAMVELLAEYKKGVFSDLMFPSRTKPEQPIDPCYVRKRLQVILKRAGCNKVRFHDLRHTFATMSLENGMDILNKREAFRQAFDKFDLETVCGYGEEKLAELGQNPGIIRNKLKIRAAVNNARIFRTIQQEWGSFERYLWHWTEGKTIYETGKVSSELSDAVSKDLKHRGMKFVGTVIIYSYLQAVGVINSHEESCFCRGRTGSVVHS